MPAKTFEFVLDQIQHQPVQPFQKLQGFKISLGRICQVRQGLNVSLGAHIARRGGNHGVSRS